jgi:TPP-dependent pyruvate/acetoin dehydrogenase alpha subunit
VLNYLDIYSQMFLIRSAEQAMVEFYRENKIFSFVHFYIGQEAIAVGVSANLRLQDRVFGNHRSHGHYLAKGGNLAAMFAEMLGKETGCCKGKGGSMHLLDRSVNFMGSTPILSSAVPIATGSALEQKMRASEEISVVYLGDGAAEEGVFTESLNLAGLMGLPVLFVIEDNLYSVNSDKAARRSEGHNFHQIANGFGVRHEIADGNNVQSVFNVAHELINYVRDKKAPAILECLTFRHMAHSAPIFDDQIGYRKLDPIDERDKVDSLKRLKMELIERIDLSEIDRVESDILCEIKKALDYAVNSPEPDPKHLLEGVFRK